MKALYALPLLCVITVGSARAETYEVGDGQALSALSLVPWEALAPGDVVRIHHRSEPYREKFVLAVSGTESAPIRIEGVPGPSGERPVIDGENATTRGQLDYWGDERSVIKVGGASTPNSQLGAHLIIEGLEIRGARATHTYRRANGQSRAYADNAAAIFIERGEHIAVRNCALLDSGNGLFVANQSRDIRLERSELAGNGNPSSIYEHNIYSEALGIVFEGNHLRPLCDGCPGNNLKDRSAGTVIRYNWIEGGNRQLDLVDSGSQTLRSDATYGQTHVYGNVLIEHDDAGNRQIVHWGGDSGMSPNYRAGTLFFYGNTVVSRRAGRTTLLRNSSPTGRAQVWGNVVHCTAGAGQLEILSDAQGSATLRNNWLTSGWTSSFAAQAMVDADGSNLSGLEPGFVSSSDLRLVADSPCVNTGALPAVDGEHALLAQVPSPRALETRPADGMPDMGALERGTSMPIDGSVGGDGGGSPQDAGSDAQTGGGGTPGGVGVPPPPLTDGGDMGGAYADPEGDDGCGCRLGHTGNDRLASLGLLSLVAMWMVRRRASARRTPD